MEQNGHNPAGFFRPAVEFMIMSAARDCQPVFGVTGLARFCSIKEEIRLFFGIARAVDEANHIVNRCGLALSHRTCPDSVVAGQPEMGEPGGHGLILPFLPGRAEVVWIR